MLENNNKEIVFSIIVPARNSILTLQKCIKSLLVQDVEELFEVIVVNDGSDDGTEEYINSLSSTIIPVHTSGLGPASARNAGAFISKGRILCFIDSDCIATENWLSTLTKPVLSGRFDAVKGAYTTEQRNIYARAIQLQFLQRYDRLEHYGKTDVVDSYSMAVTRDYFVKAGGFPEHFNEANHEDVAFSCHLTKNGASMGFVPEAKVHHIHRDTIIDFCRGAFKRGYWRYRLLHSYGWKFSSPIYVLPEIKARIAALFACIIIAPIAKARSRSFELLKLTLLIQLVLSYHMMKSAWKYDRRIVLLTPLLSFSEAAFHTIGIIWGFSRVYLSKKN